MKNALKSFGNKVDDMEERIGKFKDRNLKMIQVEEEREPRSQKIRKFYRNDPTLLGQH